MFCRYRYFASNGPSLVPILSVWRELCWSKGPSFGVKTSNFSKIPELSRNRSSDSETFPGDRAEVPGSQTSRFPRSKFDDFLEIQIFEKLPQRDRKIRFFDVSETAGLTLARPSWAHAAFPEFPVTCSFS